MIPLLFHEPLYLLLVTASSRLVGNKQVIPLYKGQGDCASVESYRPIRRKIVEKVVCAQLTFFLTVNKLLHPAQHGFVSSKLTLANLLSTDCHIANMISGHLCDIASFDFKNAFDKAPHFRIVEAASEMGVEGRALTCLSSFLTSCTRRVRINGLHSARVSSDLVQDSCLGPVLFTMLIYNLLRRIRNPTAAFVDDVKFVADLSVNSQQDVYRMT